MADHHENRIRDFLAGHLDLLEDRLALFETEYRLASPSGAGGRIDIVARDKFGHFVLIEIKRSDSSARQALHEIFKYSALFRTTLGIDHTRVRVMIVSTDWHELLAPLSECADEFQAPLEGFVIDADSDGTITSVEKVKLLPKVGGVTLCRDHGVYLFRTKAARDLALPLLSNAAKSVHLRDFFLLTIDYHGSRPDLCFPFGLYVVFSSPIPSLDSAAVKEIKEELDWEPELDSPDENFLISINRLFVSVADDIEIGFPEKLTNIRRDWRTSVAVRAGRLGKPASPLSDGELLSLAQAIEGGSSIYLHKISSPRFKDEWRLLRSNLDSVLLGMPNWKAVVSSILDEVETKDVGSTVSVSLYNPADLPMSLYFVAATADFSHCPSLEIVIEGSTENVVRVLRSVLMWTGKAITDTPDNVIERLYGGIDEWLMTMHLHSTFESEPAALAAHELSAPVIEFSCDKSGGAEPHLVEADGPAIQRTPLVPGQFLSLLDFAEAHAAYLGSLRAYLESHVGGLPGSHESDHG